MDLMIDERKLDKLSKLQESNLRIAIVELISDLLQLPAE
jgi:hypothetical protein